MGVEEEVWGLGLLVGIRGVMERVMAWTLFIDQLVNPHCLSNGILPLWEDAPVKCSCED